MNKKTIWQIGLYAVLTGVLFALSSMDFSFVFDGVPTFDWGTQTASAYYRGWEDWYIR